MFLKPFRTKSSVTVRNSDRRKVKSRLGSFFPDMTEDQIGNLIPAKGDLKENKIYTHKEYFNFTPSTAQVLQSIDYSQVEFLGFREKFRIFRIFFVGNLFPFFRVLRIEKIRSKDSIKKLVKRVGYEFRSYLYYI